MFFNASTFLGRGWIPFCVIQYPRYSISNSVKCNLLALTLRPSLLSCEKTFSSLSRFSSNVEHDAMSRSSMYTWTYSKSEKSSNMCSWKILGLLQRPIGRHWYSYLPQGVTIVHRLLLKGINSIWSFPLLRLRDIACWNPSSFSSKSWIFGIGKGLCLIHLLSSQKSEMNLTVASFFEMMKVGAAHLLLLICFNTPNLTSLSNSTFRVCLWNFGTGKGQLW